MASITTAHPEFDATLTLITGPGEDDAQQEVIAAGEDPDGEQRADALFRAGRAVEAGEAEAAFLRYVDTDGEERVIIVRLRPAGVTLTNVAGEEVPV